MQVVCPHCLAINRLAENKPAQSGQCGKCHKPLFLAAPQDVNQQQFERQLLKSDLPLVVDFWAAWCGPCKMMAPVFQQAAAQIEPRARLLKVNTEEQQSLAARFGIRSIPTLVVFSQGQEAARMSGALDLRGLLGWINQHI
ncbi:MAG: thioredoxin TrxC [Gammaproteobacteria bacterium]|nr:thioredoxin TrxC [Gammaproteobacteria bacterium]MDH5735042.1 thioredoxin TrxC [Gammaproteobacteria bacterium]